MNDIASTGVAGLDDVLHGGLPRRRIYLLQGESGAGKTTLALQFLLRGSQDGERCLYITLSETEEELRAVASSHGWSLDALHLYELTRAQDTLTTESQYTLLHPAEVELGETMKQVLAEVERVNPRRVVFDSLSEMRLLARDPLRYRRQILGLKQFFIGRDCTVVLLDDGSANHGDIQLRSLAHGVIDLELETPRHGAERRRLRVSKLRGVDFPGGFHDLRMARGGLTLFPRLESREGHPELAPQLVPSGVDQLDALLGGGLERGTCALLLGASGVGKSTIAMLYAAQAAQRGETAAVFLFEERMGTLRARADALGMDFSHLLETGRLHVREVSPSTMTSGELAQAVHDLVDRRGARVVVIDSITGYLNAMIDEQSLIVHLHELLRYLGSRGVLTILVLAQHGVFDFTGASQVELSYLADTVVLLRYFEHEGEVKVALSVVKRRSGSHERTIREIRMGPDGLRVGPPLKEFHGVLTGVPTFEGRAHHLMGAEHGARDA